MSLERLGAVWAGLPGCSVVVLRHLQKTGGSSVVKIFEDLQRDLQWSVAGYWSPCWVQRREHVAQGRLRWLRGLRRVAELSNGSEALARHLLLDSPPWASRLLLHVHHPDSTQCGGMPALLREVDRLRPVAPSLSCNVVVAMLVREPWSFFVSWWYYAGARRCGECSFARYLELNPNAQSHMAVGGKAREYSDELIARHRSRDRRLRSDLRQALRGIDLLGPTESLDQFVYMLCERAGIRTCPRPGVTNARNAAAARGVLSDVSRHGPLEAAPNASSEAQRRAVESAGWLDTWLHAEASRSLEDALAAGGPAAAAARRQRLDEWRALPADRSSGCLQVSDVSPAEATAATGRMAAAAARTMATFAESASPSQRNVLRTAMGISAPLPSGKSSKKAYDAAAAASSRGDATFAARELQYLFSVGGGGARESNGIRRTFKHEDTSRCLSLREDARQAKQLVPPVLRSVLLDPSGGSVEQPSEQPDIVAMCSTKVRIAGVRRGCHID